MATHYWYGTVVSAPYETTWDSTAWDSLPYSEGEVGYDEHQPGRPESTLPGTSVPGGSVTIFQIVGTGADVEFYVQTGPLGIAMVLYDFRLTYSTSPYGATGWYKTAYASYLGDYTKSTGFTAFLASGITYYLSVGTYASAGATGTAGQPGYSSGFGQLFTLRLTTPPTVNNDFRDNALPVAIAADGMTYISPKILNSNLTRSTTSGTDDPADLTFLHTAWWRFRPEHDAVFNATVNVSPAGFPSARLAAYRMETSGAMTLLVSTATNGGSISADADSGDIIYFVIGIGGLPGSTDPGQLYELAVTGSKTVDLPAGLGGTNPDPNPPPYIPTPETAPWDSDADPLPPDKFKPDARSAAKTSSGESTLLDLVRVFSAEVRRAVRITGPTTIEMVDPATALPTGFSSGEGGELYSTTTRSAAAQAGVLSVNAGDVALTANAQLVTNDVRLVLSNWRIPHRLPVYELPAAPVQRITYTFSPNGFEAAVDFHYAAVPLAARRT